MIEVGKVVDRAWKKRDREETFDDVFTPEKKAATLDTLSNKGALPAGLADRATNLVKSSYHNTDTFSKHNLTSTLKTPQRQQQYQTSLTRTFDSAWATSIDRHSPSTTTTSQLAAGDIEPGISLSTALDQGGLLSEDQEDTLPDEDEERISELMAREAKDRETKRLKTVEERGSERMGTYEKRVVENCKRKVDEKERKKGKKSRGDLTLC